MGWRTEQIYSIDGWGTNSSFFISTADLDALLTAIKTLADEPGFNSIAARLRRANTVEEAANIYGVTLVKDVSGNLIGVTGIDNRAGNILFLNKLAPFIPNNFHFDVVDEHGEYWRFIFGCDL